MGFTNQNFNNSRSIQRFSLSGSIDLIFGSQITLKGQIKDISLKSAFIIVKSSIHMAVNDELNFTIERPSNVLIQGSARISRVSAGEGIGIYFVNMDESSTKHLQQLIGTQIKEGV